MKVKIREENPEGTLELWLVEHEGHVTLMSQLDGRLPQAVLVIDDTGRLNILKNGNVTVKAD